MMQKISNVWNRYNSLLPYTVYTLAPEKDFAFSYFQSSVVHIKHKLL